MLKQSNIKMNNNFKEMMVYYNERAKEYDEVYIGKGPAIPYPDACRNDVSKIKKMVSSFGKGHLIDIGCGTGFWLPYYSQNCSKITLIDQSEEMILECKERVDKLRLKNRCDFVQGDFFEVEFENCLFESVVTGFFISHITSELEQVFFAKLNKILKPNAQLMIIDSAWSSKREQYRKKEGIQKRVLNNGRIFTIYKRYFNGSDIEEILERHRFKLKSSYIGDVFLVIIGNKKERR